MYSKLKSSVFLLAALFATGCYENVSESPTAPDAAKPVSEPQGKSQEAGTALYPTIAEVSSGAGKVTFLDAGNGAILLVQTIDAGRESIINSSMEGLSYGEIYSRLAPGKPVPEALKQATDRFSMDSRIGTEESSPARTEAAIVPPVLAKTAAQWDSWFQQNYCVGVTQCYLNRTGSSDWIQSTNRIHSNFWVLVYQGYQITATVKVDGSTVYASTVLYGQVWSAWANSRISFWCFGDGIGHCPQTHRLEISDGSGDGWHMSAKYY